MAIKETDAWLLKEANHTFEEAAMQQTATQTKAVVLPGSTHSSVQCCNRQLSGRRQFAEGHGFVLLGSYARNTNYCNK